ncbi:eukaryotic translation initiation factor 4 gamma-like [Lathyrus oleraceus]|uniref:eukaryotic translation initiation factor 4 gamma-like n=1 Tax=Pisum sativum TaxID=3888 RepID=UPI0021D15536|nr:eukaryotic translation initiation factor 4 gamma-like [Pisum sativum]
MVITEKSIEKLLDMEKGGGRRIYNVNPRARYMSQEIVPTIFKQNSEGKSSKNVELHQNLRAWLKIILEIHNPSSPTLAQLQAISLSNQAPSIPDTFVPSSSEPHTEPPSEPKIEPPSEPSSAPPTEQPPEPPTETTHTSSEPNNPSPEPEPTFPTLEEEAKERLEAHLAREAEEKAHQEAQEKERLEAEEQARKEAEDKVSTKAAAIAEVEAKAKVDAEEVAHIAAEDVAKAKVVALTLGETSNSRLTPLVLKSLE